MAINSFKRAGLANTNTVDKPPANFSNTATGTYTDANGIAWKYVQFNASGTLAVTSAGLCDILVVGGGGGAGAYYTSGGGAGGFVQEIVNVPVVVGNYTVTVGAGGAYTGANGGDGNNSQISGTGVLIRSGVASGGGSYNTAVLGGTCTGGEGHASANYPPACFGGRGYPSGGGGGGAGGNATSKTGGIGTNSSITGSSVGYGGGGSAGTNNGSGTASVGFGGGAGGNQNGGPNLAPTAGTANRGGGGGSRGWGDAYTSQPGGSGVVIVRVRTN